MDHVVLVVDDDRDIRDSVVELLTDHGYHAVGAANGREALAALATARSLPCLILLDLMMPVMDGLEFRAEQLKNAAWARIPVVVISAYGNVDAQARELAVDHMRKPIGVRSLIDKVRRYCPGT